MGEWTLSAWRGHPTVILSPPALHFSFGSADDGGLTSQSYPNLARSFYAMLARVRRSGVGYRIIVSLPGVDLRGLKDSNLCLVAGTGRLRCEI